MIRDRADVDPSVDAAIVLTSIGRVLSRRLFDLLLPTGLKPRHMGPLMALRPGPISQQGLAEQQSLHPVKLVALLNDLEEAGLVTRRRDPDDRRRHTVALSELGRARLAAVDVAREKLDAEVFAGISRTQRALLGSVIERIAENLGLVGHCAIDAAEESAPPRP